MKEYHIACGQYVAVPAEKEKNLMKIADLSDEAARRGCELIVFPEMALTGYIPPKDLAPLAEPIDGPFLSRVADTARRVGIAIVIGFPELVPHTGIKHNSFAVFNTTGTLETVYRKIHLWDTEAAWATPGDGIVVADMGKAKVSGWICYDTRFPELARLCFFEDVELCLVPTAWLGPGDEWELSLRARALDNAFFVAGADLINPYPGLECKGLSMIVDPYGKVLTRAEAGEECVIDAVLAPDHLAAQRKRLPLRRDRRPALYRPLIEPGR